jgi:hypothetical protein
LANGYIDLTEYLTTHRTTSLFQQLSSSTLGRLRFEQEGSVQAVTPAFAVEVTPRFSLGIAVNIYQDALLGADAIRSQTRARYSGTLDSQSRVTDTHMTSGDWSYSGEYVSPTVSFPLDPDHGKVPEYSTTESLDDLTRLQYEGYYDVYDRIDDFRGINANAGALWKAQRKTHTGVLLWNLPWTAARASTERPCGGDRCPIKPAADTAMRSRVARISNRFSPVLGGCAACIGTTGSRHPSPSANPMVALCVQGGRRAGINPLDGNAARRHPIDDCWAGAHGRNICGCLRGRDFRTGRTLLGAASAVGPTDDYWGFSLDPVFDRTGRDKRSSMRLHLSWGNDVMARWCRQQRASYGRARMIFILVHLPLLKRLPARYARKLQPATRFNHDTWASAATGAELGAVGRCSHAVGDGRFGADGRLSKPSMC